jgi:hypothetical protein
MPFVGDRLRPTTARRFVLGNGDPETVDIGDGVTLPVGVGLRLIVPSGPSDRIVFRLVSIWDESRESVFCGFLALIATGND